MSAAYDLPLELHYKIIDNTDFVTANQYALVSRAWLQRARHAWWSRRSIMILLPLWQPHLIHPIDVYMKMITHPHCTFLHLNLHLYIRGPVTDARLVTLSAEEKIAIYTKIDQVLFSISKLSIKFATVVLENLSLSQMQPSSIIVLKSFTDLRKLDLVEVKFPSMGELCSFAVNFPLLHTFNIKRLDMLPISSGTIPQPRLGSYGPMALAFRSIKQMSLDMISIFNGFVGALRCHHCPVEELTLSVITTEYLSLVVPLLSHIGEALHILRLDAYFIGRRYNPNSSHVPQSLPLLNQNTKLTSITIYAICVDESRRYPTWWLALLLGSVNSQTFKKLELKLVMGPYSGSSLKQFDWSQLDDLGLGLVRSHPLLEHISIDVENRGLSRHENKPEWALAVRSQLPKLVAAGKLEVT